MLGQKDFYNVYIAKIHLYSPIVGFSPDIVRTQKPARRYYYTTRRACLHRCYMASTRPNLCLISNL